MNNHSKLIGATLIVAGTAIGAGMLALPLATSAVGFWPALALMIACWGLSAYSALLMLEVNLKVGSDVNFHNMSGRVFGAKGQAVAMVSMLGLLYALTAAYLSGGGSLLTLKLQGLMTLPDGSASVIFAILLGSFTVFGIRYIDALTKLMFTVMMLALALVLFGLLPEVQPSNLPTAEATTGASLVALLPVLITSFGFHVCIPTLVRYLDGDVKQLRTALLVGSTLPFVCYVLWLLAALGSLTALERAALNNGDALAALIQNLSEKAQWGGIGQALTLFADLALVTSFLGVSLSLYDYLAELCRTGNSIAGRLVTWKLTFVPPLLLALFFPGGFVAMLGYAAVPLMVLIVLLPVAMAYKLRAQQAGYQVAGGQLGLGLATFGGLLVIASQIYVA
ncbi:amino acid permease [Ferrimonas senticii]|uniref:amino acid permease n=1 Tax=Ferrimonas senticii TaxID=394566 RepID=UPI0003F6E376|nr:aromatic amino acid transport family protein [Ferrimonas senticii]